MISEVFVFYDVFYFWVFSTSQEISREDRLSSDIQCVKQDVKPDST